ncbi:hypothetical protein LCGC14_1365300 [marine sediment metagenome]|uniref:Uncharacterized protein n=1 Tax=marine sediment metagenome TaxID=412755 RepID=A0A0F9MM36_9ZZZZ
MPEQRIDIVGRRQRADRRDGLERRLAPRRISVIDVTNDLRHQLERRMEEQRTNMRRLFPDRRAMDSGSFGSSHFQPH